MAAEHTALPWKVEMGHCVVSPGVGVIATVSGRAVSSLDDCANAEFIVRAANCHEELVELAERLEMIYDNIAWLADERAAEHMVAMEPLIRSALAKARGEAS